MRQLILDTETTGLAGGTGTYVFLVGVGFFDGDEFEVRQYFMRDLDEEPALQGVSFNVSAGETRVILGQAGSGKTTLLKACIGLIRPDSGRIRLFNQDITDMKTNTRSVS